jgi:hypothetical protein
MEIRESNKDTTKSSIYNESILQIHYSLIFNQMWSSMVSALQRAIAETKQHSQWSVIEWVTTIYCLELLRASGGTLSHCCWLHLQSLAPTPVSRRVDVRQAVNRKNICLVLMIT